MTDTEKLVEEIGDLQEKLRHIVLHPEQGLTIAPMSKVLDIVTKADDALTAAQQEIARLREALERIAAHQYGLQNVADDHGHDTNSYNFHAMKYWSELARHQQSAARKALEPSGETR